MDKNEIDIKSLALKMKMRRFTMKSVAITGYYDASNASIAFIDPSEYVWHVSNRYGTILSIGVEENSKYYAWMKEVSKRKTTKDLHERYRAVLVEGIDYAHAGRDGENSCKNTCKDALGLNVSSAQIPV